MMKILLWGAGNTAKNILSNCHSLVDYKIFGFIDNDKAKIGSCFMKYDVFSPEILNSKKLNNNIDKIVLLMQNDEEVVGQIKKKYPRYASKIENKNFFIKNSILTRYKNTNDLEIKDICRYIEEHGLEVFNYRFVEKYKNMDLHVQYDDAKGMYYIEKNRNIYFPQKFKSAEQVKKYYLSLMVEQDPLSPHRYMSNDFYVENGDVVVDVGAAEGNFQ